MCVPRGEPWRFCQQLALRAHLGACQIPEVTDSFALATSEGDAARRMHLRRAAKVSMACMFDLHGVMLRFVTGSVPVRVHVRAPVAVAVAAAVAVAVAVAVPLPVILCLRLCLTETLQAGP